MKTEVKVIVDVSNITGEQRLTFVSKVLDAFREVFPDAKPLDPSNSDRYVPPVTVTIQTEDKKDN